MSAAAAMAPQTRPQFIPDTFKGTSGAMFWRVVFPTPKPLFQRNQEVAEDRK